MVNKTTYSYEPSDITFHPGETLIEILEANYMSQKELADRTGITKKTIQEIVQGRAPVSVNTAVTLEKALGIKASFWLNLQAEYEADCARIEAQKQLQDEIVTARCFPYTEMVKQGMVPARKLWEERVEALQHFFAVASLDRVELTLKAAFRRKENPYVSPYALAAWLRQGEIAGSQIETSTFSKKCLRAMLPTLFSMSQSNWIDTKKDVVKMCADCGIAVAIVPHISKTYVNGATKWLSSEKVLVVLSLKGSYTDIIWFSLAHELGHIMKGHSRKDTFINVENDKDRNEKEVEADTFASEQLIPGRALKLFCEKEDFSVESIQNFAKKIQRSPGIVAGRLAHLDYIGWNVASELRIKK